MTHPQLLTHWLTINIFVKFTLFTALRPFVRSSVHAYMREEVRTSQVSITVTHTFLYERMNEWKGRYNNYMIELKLLCQNLRWHNFIRSYVRSFYIYNSGWTDKKPALETRGQTWAKPTFSPHAHIHLHGRTNEWKGRYNNFMIELKLLCQNLRWHNFIRSYVRSFYI